MPAVSLPAPPAPSLSRRSLSLPPGAAPSLRRPLPFSLPDPPAPSSSRRSLSPSRRRQLPLSLPPPPASSLPPGSAAPVVARSLSLPPDAGPLPLSLQLSGIDFFDLASGSGAGGFLAAALFARRMPAEAARDVGVKNQKVLAGRSGRGRLFRHSPEAVRLPAVVRGLPRRRHRDRGVRLPAVAGLRSGARDRPRGGGVPRRPHQARSLSPSRRRLAPLSLPAPAAEPPTATGRGAERRYLQRQRSAPHCLKTTITYLTRPIWFYHQLEELFSDQPQADGSLAPDPTTVDDDSDDNDGIKENEGYNVTGDTDEDADSDTICSS